MANNLRHIIQDINLGIDDVPFPLPLVVVFEAARENQFSLIGRVLVLRHQNFWVIVATLPRTWGLNGMIAGRLLEHKHFQFVFPPEDLLQSVLNKGSWAFNDRMIILRRWNQGMTELELSSLPFGVHIRGISLQYLTCSVIGHIGGSLRQVLAIDCNPAATTAVEFIRIKIDWSVDFPLRFQKNYHFTPGVNTLLTFKYERLRGLCHVCVLTHDTSDWTRLVGSPVHAPNHDAQVEVDGINDARTSVMEPMITQLPTSPTGDEILPVNLATQIQPVSFSRESTPSFVATAVVLLRRRRRPPSPPPPTSLNCRRRGLNCLRRGMNCLRRGVNCLRRSRSLDNSRDVSRRCSAT